MVVYRVELDLDGHGGRGVVKDQSRLLLAGIPQVDPTDVQQLVPNLESNLSRQAVVADRADEDALFDPTALFNGDSKLLRRTLDVDQTDVTGGRLSGQALVLSSPVG